jgi:hypothetical protein
MLKFAARQAAAIFTPKSIVYENMHNKDDDQDVL